MKANSESLETLHTHTHTHTHTILRRKNKGTFASFLGSKKKLIEKIIRLNFIYNNVVCVNKVKSFRVVKIC